MLYVNPNKVQLTCSRINFVDEYFEDLAIPLLKKGPNLGRLPVPGEVEYLYNSAYILHGSIDPRNSEYVRL